MQKTPNSKGNKAKSILLNYLIMLTWPLLNIDLLGIIAQNGESDMSGINAI